MRLAINYRSPDFEVHVEGAHGAGHASRGEDQAEAARAAAHGRARCERWAGWTFDWAGWWVIIPRLIRGM